jgi:hypothetical protein
MSSKLTGMTEGVVVGLTADNGGRPGEALKSGLAGVPEATVPSSRRRGGHKSACAGRRRQKLQGVQRARAVTSQEGVPGTEILHRNTKRVKFNRN